MKSRRLKLGSIRKFRPRLAIKSPSWRWLFTGILLVSFVGALAASVLFLRPKTAVSNMGQSDTDGGSTVVSLCSRDELQGAALQLIPARRWYLEGKEFLGKGPLSANVRVVETPDCLASGLEIKFSVEQKPITGEAKTNQSGSQTISVPIDTLPVGSYKLEVTVAIPGEEPSLTAATDFYISKPVYIAWTLDWEGYNFSDEYLSQIQRLTERAQSVPITHFFNPYYFISTGNLNARGKYFANWIKNRQATSGDDVGMHVHMFYSLASAAGVEPRYEPTWAARGTGSDVPLSSYTYEEQKQILDFSLTTLRNQGFTDMTSFRAGGWFANLDTMKALDELGFKMESSGRTSYSLGNNLTGPWTLVETTQPYYMCLTNQNRACRGNQAFDLLQVPNNGGESFRFSSSQLLNRFKVNYDGKPQNNHKVITYLSHPEWFNVDFPKITELFNYIDESLYAADKGPVVYTTLDGIYQAWQVNNL